MLGWGRPSGVLGHRGGWGRQPAACSALWAPFPPSWSSWVLPSLPQTAAPSAPTPPTPPPSFLGTCKTFAQPAFLPLGRRVWDGAGGPSGQADGTLVASAGEDWAPLPPPPPLRMRCQDLNCGVSGVSESRALWCLWLGSPAPAHRGWDCCGRRVSSWVVGQRGRPLFPGCPGPGLTPLPHLALVSS